MEFILYIRTISIYKKTCLLFFILINITNISKIYLNQGGSKRIRVFSCKTLNIIALTKTELLH